MFVGHKSTDDSVDDHVQVSNQKEVTTVGKDIEVYINVASSIMLLLNMS